MPYRRFKRYDPRFYYNLLKFKIGRRGSVLFFLGLIWVFQGLNLVLQVEPSSYYILNHFNNFRAIIWMVTGLCAIYYSQKPQGHDIFGYIALYIMAAYRVIGYGYDFVLWMVPGGIDGNPRGIVGVFSWATVIILLVVISGWVEDSQKQVSHDRN